jgi:hypothetical protein
VSLPLSSPTQREVSSKLSDRNKGVAEVTNQKLVHSSTQPLSTEEKEVNSMPSFVLANDVLGNM